MADIRRMQAGRVAIDMERLAPRFAAVAAVIPVSAAIANAWSLGSLFSELQTVYAVKAVTVVSTSWRGM